MRHSKTMITLNGMTQGDIKFNITWYHICDV